jgi:hypothetical protein
MNISYYNTIGYGVQYCSAKKLYNACAKYAFSGLPFLDNGVCFILEYGNFGEGKLHWRVHTVLRFFHL